METASSTSTLTAAGGPLRSNPSIAATSPGHHGRAGADPSSTFTESPSSTATFTNFAAASLRRYFNTTSPGATTSSTKQYAGMDRVAPHTRNSSPSRQTPR